MRKKKSRKVVSSPQPPTSTTPNPQKILWVVLVIAVVGIGTALFDFWVKNPPSRSWDEATNQLFMQGVVANNPEITYDTPLEMDEKTSRLESIAGKNYYVIPIVTYGDTPQEKVYGPYYVATSNSRIYLMDEASNQLAPYNTP